jgi:hypothetical protein
MAEIADNLLLDLQELFKIVAFRANRLGEWTELELRSRPLERSIAKLNRDADRAAKLLEQGGGDPSAWPNIFDSWSTFRNDDVQMLEAFSSRIEFINKPLSSNPGDDYGPALTTWIGSVRQMCDEIEAAVDSQTAPQLRQKCRQFEDGLKSETSSHRGQVEYEIKQLTTLTTRLKEKLDILLPHLPVVPKVG